MLCDLTRPASRDRIDVAIHARAYTILTERRVCAYQSVRWTIAPRRGQPWTSQEGKPVNFDQAKKINRLAAIERRAWARHDRAKAAGNTTRAVRAGEIIKAIDDRFSRTSPIFPA